MPLGRLGLAQYRDFIKFPVQGTFKLNISSIWLNQQYAQENI